MLAIVPDWQYVTQIPASDSSPQGPAAWLQKQIDLAKNNALSCNVIAVISLGDMVNNLCNDNIHGGVYSTTQDSVPAFAAWDQLEGTGTPIPAMATNGNHDGSAGHSNGESRVTFTNAWFADVAWVESPTFSNTDCTSGTLPAHGSVSKTALLAKGLSWWNSSSQFFESAQDYKSSSQSGQSFLNRYFKLDVAGRHFLIMSLEFKFDNLSVGPVSDVQTWALGVANANPTYEVIVVSHQNLFPASNNTVGSATDNAWTRTLASMKNLILVLNGHLPSSSNKTLADGGMYYTLQRTQSNGTVTTGIGMDYQGVDLDPGATSSTWQPGAEKAFIGFVTLPNVGGNIEVRAISANTLNWVGPYTGTQPGSFGTPLLTIGGYNGIGITQGSAAGQAAFGGTVVIH